MFLLCVLVLNKLLQFFLHHLDSKLQGGADFGSAESPQQESCTWESQRGSCAESTPSNRSIRGSDVCHRQPKQAGLLLSTRQYRFLRAR